MEDTESDAIVITRLRAEVDRLRAANSQWHLRISQMSTEQESLKAALAQAEAERDENEKQLDHALRNGIERTLLALTGETDLIKAMKHLAPDLTLDVLAQQMRAKLAQAEQALRALIVKWRAEAEDDAKCGVGLALCNHQEYYGSVNTALASRGCADELEAALRAIAGEE